MAIKTYTDKYSGQRHWFDDATEQVSTAKNVKGEDMIAYRKDLVQLTAEGKEDWGRSTPTWITPIEPIL